MNVATFVHHFMPAFADLAANFMLLDSLTWEWWMVAADMHGFIHQP